MAANGIIGRVKRRRGILIVALGLGLVTLLVAAFWPEHHGPSYQGVTLEAWLQRYALDRSPGAADAVRHIGTNCLPFLLKRISHETSVWKKKLSNYVPRGLWGPGRPILMWVVVDGQGVRGDRASLGFEIL